ncbi:regulator of G-protein signaling 16 isoform X1 [Gopherus flavomarginatus]|uniref:regulator of G-protein signaling 16 isoform X1 n=1 Tax=Gopherus evgoodei TaxID=1825980 RepID=UPI0011CFB6BE|nr:regulator of G-protein signaling 16 isoform X1 [Gopherus evgoodei]XP_050816880.1 regulator of G-protein signaling 16 isoform X1 [Gopherus flavomarginatus]
MCRGLTALSTCLERAKLLKTRLGILLHKPELGHEAESFSTSEQGTKLRKTTGHSYTMELRSGESSGSVREREKERGKGRRRPQRNSSEEALEWKKSFDHLLKSKNGVATFHAFLKTEFSEENLEFWLACEEFKKSRSKTKLSSKAHRIFKEFVQNEAPKEVNIDHETREITRKNLTAATTTCFDAAQAKTRTLMEKDSYPRFLKSTSYQGLTEQVISHSTSKRLHT